MKKRRTPEKHHENMMRMRARRQAEKEWKVVPNWEKEVDHIRWVKAGNGKSNIRIISRKLNRRLWAMKANRGR
jgi:hypothetical protein